MNEPWEEQATAYERAIQWEQRSQNEIAVAFPVNLPVEVCVELLASLDKLHRIEGGNGLAIVRDQTVPNPNGSDTLLFILSGDRDALAKVGEHLRKIVGRVSAQARPGFFGRIRAHVEWWLYRRRLRRVHRADGGRDG
jgi:hypothetical protein